MYSGFLHGGKWRPFILRLRRAASKMTHLMITVLFGRKVAFEIEATQMRVNDAEIAFQKQRRRCLLAILLTGDLLKTRRDEYALAGDRLLADDAVGPSAKGFVLSHEIHDQENGNINLDLQVEAETEIEKSTNGFQGKKLESQQKDLTKDGFVSPNVSKALLKKSSRFFPASSSSPTPPAARLSLKKKGLHFPPWRKPEYMAAKWLALTVSRRRQPRYRSRFR
ncbi:hypothetical protein J5N97_029642 [Dioscorea zingiberensis]|uniref:Uncharacterized protein n=1 Tax=Dioscorea zingiberensis TaxID=325984 RepID=A0A9D5BVR9_9LILI|nr:hypothetical protein J5N97_029642 [Dioscorea zingiberensis]